MHVHDSYLTYGLSLSSWSHELPSKPLHALLVASLTTLISYQAASLFLDLSLLTKPRSKAPLTTLLAVLISDLCTPLATLVTLYPSRALAALAYRHAPPPQPFTAVKKPRGRTLLILLLFLLTPPLANLLSLVVTLDYDTTLSFSDSRFGGLALGLNASQPPLRTTPATVLCAQYALHLLPNDWPLADFFQCTQVASAAASHSGTSFVGAKLRKDAVVEVEMDLRPVYVRSETSLEMWMEEEGRMYRVGAAMGERELRQIVEFGVGEVERACEGGRIGDVEIIETGDGELEVRQRVAFCAAGDADEVGLAGMVVGKSVENLTVVDDGGLFRVGEVGKDRGVGKFANVGGMGFVRRRRSLVGFWGLGVLGGVLVILRLVVGAIVGNDLYVGVELILKKMVGGRCCDGLLQRTEVVNYYGEGDPVARQ